jgi:predicted nucleotidyltransferase
MEPDDIASRLWAQNAPESHLRRIRALEALARSEPALRALALVGSYAKGVGDRVSDLDLVALVDAGCADHVLASAHDVLRSDEVLDEFSGRHSGSGFWKLVYLDFASVEFHVFEPTSPFRLRRPYLPIWDPAAVLPALVVDGEPVRHEDFEAYQYGDDGLLWELVDCVKWLSRGNHTLAKRHIKKIASKLQAGDESG